MTTTRMSTSITITITIMTMMTMMRMNTSTIITITTMTMMTTTMSTRKWWSTRTATGSISPTAITITIITTADMTRMRSL